MDLEQVSQLLNGWGYSAFVFLLWLTGVGSPVPEDLLLIAAGYLIFTGTFDWAVAVPLGIVGVVGSDLAVYVAGRGIFWRSDCSGKTLNLSWARLQRVHQWLIRFGAPCVLVARLLPGTRTPVFLSAGFHGMPVAHFLGYDTLGATIWVPAMLGMGHAFGARIGGLGDVVEWLVHGATYLTLAMAILFVLWLEFGTEASKL